MILQALTDYYQTLAASGKIARLGWGPAKISFALYLRPDGSLERVADIRTEQLKGKKTVIAPQLMELPMAVKRSSGVASNFLWDNSGYLLGIDDKGKPQRTAACFNACKELHERLLAEVDTPAARALLTFFQTWDPEEDRNTFLLAQYREEILAGANLVFRYAGAYVHEDTQIQQAWDRAFCADREGPEMVCLVTGEKGPVESIHPSIKNVAGAQSSGAALVSFNAPAFCSYGKEQNLNAPTSQYAAFAYTSVLNYLLSDRERVWRIGDTTLVCWAGDGGDPYKDFFGCSLFGGMPASYDEKDLRGMLTSLCQGKQILFQEEQLDPNMAFYILGLAPNAARLSVRFFLRNSFGAFLSNVQAHHQRLEICRPAYDPFETLPLWRLLDETVNQNVRDKTAVPGMAGETLRSILLGIPYPATLLNGVMLRIRAEHEVTRGRAAIIKAYYLKNKHPDVPEEVLTMCCNENSGNIAYRLGRLFSVLEEIQSAANPGINTTIKDKYFNAASSTPAVVFPILINLAQKHLRKLPDGQRIWLEKKLMEIVRPFGETYPTRLNLQQQGSFQLGYYHQTQLRFTAKNKEEK